MISNDDGHFRQFRAAMEAAIGRCEAFDTEEDPRLRKQQERLYQRQKDQVDNLVSLERQFRLALVATPAGRRVYELFVSHICDERRNILDARPFFRERQQTFTDRVSPVLRAREAAGLHDFRINFRFVQFAMRTRKWGTTSKVARLAAQIAAAREELVVMNLPLAINRAHIFFARTPRAHLTYMDLVQIAAEGLMAGVDKFVPPFSRMFRGVAIGRMVGNFIENYSETVLKFYPPDRRKLYRANKLVGRSGGLDPEELAARVNEWAVDAAEKTQEPLEPGQLTSPGEIAHLMAAASMVSSDSPLSDSESETSAVRTVGDTFSAPEEDRPDVLVERADAHRALYEAFCELTLLEQKLLRLKGVRMEVAEWKL